MADAKFAIPKLNGTNWQTWKIRLESLLSREDLWHVIAEEIPGEAARDNAWNTANRKAKATLVLLLEDSQLPLVKNAVYARDAFNALKAYHQKTSRSVRVSLLKKLCSTNLPEHGDLEKHLLEIDDLFDRLSAAGTELDKDTQICLLLRSLPPSFDGLVTALDSRSDDDISLDVVKSKLSDEYHRRLERNASTGKVEKAMKSAGNTQKSELRVCHYCKRPGHIKINCRKFLASKNEHESGAPKPGRSDKAKAAQSDGNSVAFCASNETSRTWVIDSGASAHMTNDRSFFDSLREFAGGWITLADGKKTQIRGEGSGVLFGIDGQENVKRIEFGCVKYVPGLSTSLISVGMLVEKNLEVQFSDKGCHIVDSFGSIVATGGRVGGLYNLRLAERSMVASTGHHRDDCQHQWHRRLGHRDWTAVQRINTEQLATGMRITDCGLRVVCECCLQGKASRFPFPEVIERKSTQVLDIIHTDLCGPMSNVTPSGNRYVLNLVDDFSRFTVTYLLKHKWEAAESIKAYVRWVENNFGRKPRVIRSDGGGEFNNKELRKFYQDEGIQPQFTTPYSPQQNGVAERKNRTLSEMATCMLLDAGLEKRFWGEAIRTATYLQNRLPSRSVAKTPYEIWWGRKPDLAHLRVFGSEAYVHVPDCKRRKLDSKARKLTFVGYSMEHKGYRFLDRETDQITISRDARFIELGNGSSSVDVPAIVPDSSEVKKMSEEKKEEVNLDRKEEIVLLPFEEKIEEEEEIQLLPFVEKIEEEDEIQLLPLVEEEEEVVSSNDEFEDAEPDEVSEVLRAVRSTRGVKPKLFEDFVVDLAAGVATCTAEEPSDYREAMQKIEWRNAMKDELSSHARNETWELTPLPPGKKVVGSRWVFKVKRDEENRIVKHKARIVAQGFTQSFGDDFDEVFAPVVSHATLRTFLVVAAKQKLVVRHLDVKTAYLYGSLDDEIYMRQPPGCKAKGQEELVCRLKRSIYGLRQSARCWNRRLNDALIKRGFKQSSVDPCLYVRESNGIKTYLLVYVDDFLIGSTDEEELRRICESLNQEFEITCLGEVRHFLGMEVQRENGIYKISLSNYIDKLIEKNGMQDAKPVKSPMDVNYLRKKEETVFEDGTKYRSLVGGLLYLAVNARPDIAACTAILGRKVSAPCESDWSAAKRVLRYLKGTKNYQLRLGGDINQPLTGYADADWADDTDSRRSTTGFVLSFGGGVVSWASRRQQSVTLSSMEAEYVSLSETCQEVVWLRKLLCDFGENQDSATIIKEDNQGCLAFVKSERSSRRSKHIDTRERFIQELCDKKEVMLEYCSTDLMIADLLTKPLGPVKHQKFCDMIGFQTKA